MGFLDKIIAKSFVRNNDGSHYFYRDGSRKNCYEIRKQEDLEKIQSILGVLYQRAILLLIGEVLFSTLNTVVFHFSAKKVMPVAVIIAAMVIGSYYRSISKAVAHLPKVARPISQNFGKLIVKIIILMVIVSYATKVRDRLERARVSASSNQNLNR